MKRFLSNLLMLTGISLFAFSGYVYYQRTNPNRIAFEAHAVPKQVQTTMTTVSQPAAITISAIDVALPVLPAAIVGGSWETTAEGVSYLSSSPVPGQPGNSILYGHNWKNLLGRLPEVKPGDSIEITYADTTTKTFEVEYTVVVKPDDVHILKPSQDTRITLYTCTGFLDQERFVVVALLQKK